MPQVAGAVPNTALVGLGLHYPVLEISSRSRLSSVCWSGYIKGHLAAADYEGVVQLWDANTNSELAQFEEHAKRVWSIDFSQVHAAAAVLSVRLWVCVSARVLAGVGGWVGGCAHARTRTRVRASVHTFARSARSGAAGWSK